jgi:hypothetical protein
VEAREINEHLLRAHGIPPGKKTDGILRLIYENLNGINSRLSNSDKLDKHWQNYGSFTLDRGSRSLSSSPRIVAGHGGVPSVINSIKLGTVESASVL